MKKIDSMRLLETQVTSSLCETVGSPRALTVKLLMQYGEWNQLVDLSINPDHYVDPQKFADDYLVTEVMRKSDSLPLGIDRGAECEALFYRCESKNAMTNSRLIGANHPEWFHTVRGEFRGILGHLTKGVLEKILSSCHFGPGVSVGVKGDGLVPSIKFDSSLSLTRSLIPFSRALMGELWWQHNSEPREVVRGSEFFTVPKNAKAFRGCCKEPTLNAFGQLGIGSYLGRRLRLFGVDLRDQSRNQAQARLAYERRGATIDLSSASDLLSRGLVYELATNEWCHLLELFRSPATKIAGKWHDLEMFSSMGNGYTFPLETAIFLSVIRASVPHDQLGECAVYGDDIVCPQRYASTVVDRLEYLGFEVNRRKTRLAGVFFESCGADFFKGVNVRPFYLRRQVGTHNGIPYELQIANALRIYANRRGYGEFCDERFLPLWKDLKARLRRPWKDTKVPAHFGDVGLIVSPGDCRLSRPKANSRWSQNEGFVAYYARPSSINADRQTYGVALATYANGSADFSRGFEPKRGIFGRTVLGRATTLWSTGYDWL